MHQPPDLCRQPLNRRLLQLGGLPLAEAAVTSGRWVVGTTGLSAEMLAAPAAMPLTAPLLERLCHLAGRAAYSLRLGRALAYLEVVAGRPALIALHAAAPVKYSGAADLPGAAATLTLGADPEFVLCCRQSGKLVPASRFFSPDGMVGLDALVVRGQRPLGELRPPPARDPLQLVAAVGRALGQAAARVASSDVTWRAGSQPVPPLCTGGHIHFGGIPPSPALLTALDNYLAVPLFLLEAPAPACQRRQRFGRLGEFAFKDHGGFEYRTPASWLISPRVAAAALCLAHLVATHHGRLRGDWLARPALQVAFYGSRKGRFRALFPRLWADLAALPEYGAYRRELDWLAGAVKRGLEWREDRDLLPAWQARDSQAAGP